MLTNKIFNASALNWLITSLYFIISTSKRTKTMMNISGPTATILLSEPHGQDWLSSEFAFSIFHKSNKRWGLLV